VHLFKRLAVALLLTAFAESGIAAWVVVLEGEDFTAYADPATIDRVGNTARMWDVMDLKYPQPSPRGNPYSSSLAHTEFDCANDRMRTLHFSLHSGQMGEGDVVEAFADPNKWLPVAPGTLLKILAEFACGEK
jgi:hypothetical protein